MSAEFHAGLINQAKSSAKRSQLVSKPNDRFGRGAITEGMADMRR